MPQKPPQCWTLYLLECSSGAYYTGITTDFMRRWNEHLAGVGAKYTRSNPPVALVGMLMFDDRAAASRAEAQVKKLAREMKPAYFR
jgi:putative endonuclease